MPYGAVNSRGDGRTGGLALAIRMIALLVSTAFAYETDQLTDRDAPLADALDYANATMNDLLDAIVADLDAKPHTAVAPVTRGVIAWRIRHDVDYTERLHGRGFWRGFGYGHYSVALETGPIDRRSFLERTDIYGGLGLFQSLILHVAGPCSTINLAGFHVGTDKIDHFLVDGYETWRHSHDGTDDAGAIDWATRTENTWLGHYTSGAFSYGDLRADYDGYRFYAGLLGPDSVIGLAADGGVVRKRSWDWTEWVSADWDEVLNPNVYNRGVQKGVSARLDADRASVCASYARWGDDRYRTALAARVAAPPDWAGPRAPARFDPFQLDALCGSVAGGQADLRSPTAAPAPMPTTTTPPSSQGQTP